MKKLMLGILFSLTVVLSACNKDDEHGPAEIVEEFAGTYTVDVVVAPVSDFDITGLTTNKAFPTTSAKGELKAVAASDNAEHAILTLTLSGQLLGKIDNTDLTFELRAVDFKEPDDTHTPTYALQSAKLSSKKLTGGSSLPLEGAQVRSVKGANLNWDGYVNLPVAALKMLLSDADATKLDKAVKDNDNPSAIRTQLKVTTSNAKRK